MERENNKSLIVLIILLVIAILAGIFFAVATYHKKFNDKKYIYINDKKFKLKGFNEKINKYITTDDSSCFGVSALVLTENNTVYFGASSGKEIPVTKLTTDKKISDITKKGIEPHLSGTGGCNELGLFVKLKNNQLKPVKLKYDETKDIVNAFLADYDVKDIKYQLDDILIFKDHSITTVTDFNKDQTKRIQLDNNTFKIDAIVGSFYIEDDKLVDKPTKQVEPHMMCYLAISNNKSYSLCGSAYSYEPPRSISEIKLYNEGINKYIITDDGTVTIENNNGTKEEIKTTSDKVYEFK